MLEVVINVSEGKDLTWLKALATSAVGCADLHTDEDHHRSVLTIVGPAPDLLDTVVEIGRRAVADLNLTTHEGVHPRVGVIDVVPFVPIGTSTMVDAIKARDAAAERLASELGLPCFLYGPIGPTTTPHYVERTLPELRRDAFTPILPDVGPSTGHPTAGAVAVGARGLLVAWNIWLDGVDLRHTRRISSALRNAAVRTLGFEVRGGTQISFNLVDPTMVTPNTVFDETCRLLRSEGFDESVIKRCELVGLVPQACLDKIPEDRWELLDLSNDRTIESSAQRLGITVS